MMTSQHYSKVLSLIGFMGCGKSTVGRLLAKKCGAVFIDLDSIIEEKEGRSIPEIFSTHGESGFRALESDCLKEVLNKFVKEDNANEFAAVLSLGGGTLTTANCAEIIKKSTFCIYLKASPETLLKNLKGSCSGRPILNGCADDAELMKRISTLLEKRSATYENSAQVHITTDGKSPEEVISEILQYTK